MNLIDNIQNSLGIGTTAETNSDTASSENISSLDQGFGSLLSLLQENKSGDSTTDTTDVGSPIDSIQKNLLSAIGLDQLAGDALSQLTSLSSLSTLQTSLLSNLNASLFSAATAATTAEKVTAATDLSSSDANQTFLSSVQDFSTYAVGEDGLGVDDFFDTVNILNHIPLVSDIYQEASDTKIDPLSEIVGGFVYGGPIGMAFAAADIAIESFTGKSIYDNLTDFMFEDTEKESIASTVTQVTDTIEQANKAYNFATRAY